LQLRDILRHLILLRGKLLLLGGKLLKLLLCGGKLLLLGSQLLDAAPHEGEILHHRLKLLRQLGRRCRRGGRRWDWCNRSRLRQRRTRRGRLNGGCRTPLLGRDISTDRRRHGPDTVRVSLPGKGASGTDQNRYEKTGKSAAANRAPVVRERIVFETGGARRYAD
jgi:hypothetical protein